MPLSPPPATFHSSNRQSLAKFIGIEAVAVIDTADVLTRPGDYEYGFHPDSNFYYLTGVAEPEAVLILVPGHTNPDLRELLFISGTSEFVGTWEGERLTPGLAAATSGIKTVLPLTELASYLERLLAKYNSVYLNAEESLESFMSSPSKRRAAHLHQTLPLHYFHSALPQLARQRMIKHPAEVEQLRAAIEITGAGLAAAYRALQPGLQEYHLEAELSAEFTRHGSTNAFLPIVAAGKSGTVIHHMKNNGPVQADNLVLFDVGAQSHYYAADISRTVPVSGRFSPRQRAVYTSVLSVQRAAIAMLKPGLNKTKYEEKIGEILLDELVKLELLKPAEAQGKSALKHLRRFYPHAASHFLGLDTHDVGDYSVPLEPGMVLTVEPGIYIKEEGIGIRLEDDVLITPDGCEVLSRAIPSDPDEVEAAINQAH